MIAAVLLRSPCSRRALCHIPFGGRWTSCLGVHIREKKADAGAETRTQRAFYSVDISSNWWVFQLNIVWLAAMFDV